MGKINNRQRKEFCDLVNSRNEKTYADLEVKLDDSLQIAADHIVSTNKAYIHLAKQYDKAKMIERKIGVEFTSAKDKAEELAKKIRHIGVTADTKELLIKTSGYQWNKETKRHETEKIPATENGTEVCNNVRVGILLAKQDLTDKISKVKENIWLAETVEEARELMKGE
jgi:hypothetical protein